METYIKCKNKNNNISIDYFMQLVILDSMKGGMPKCTPIIGKDLAEKACG